MLEVLNKIVNFIFVTFKICTRDLYVLPLGNIDEFLIIGATLMSISVVCTIVHLPTFIDYRGAILAMIILLIIKVWIKLEERRD